MRERHGLAPTPPSLGADHPFRFTMNSTHTGT